MQRRQGLARCAEATACALVVLRRTSPKWKPDPSALPRNPSRLRIWNQEERRINSKKNSAHAEAPGPGALR